MLTATPALAELNGQSQRPALRQAQATGLGRSARCHDNGTAQKKGGEMMDKQGRVTRWDELELGVFYSFSKGGRDLNPPRELVVINNAEGYVELAHRDSQSSCHLVRWYNWQGRLKPHTTETK
jgi:hypothetical protein